jgi:hypothetical protein
LIGFSQQCKNFCCALYAKKKENEKKERHINSINRSINYQSINQALRINLSDGLLQMTVVSQGIVKKKRLVGHHFVFWA